MRARNEWIRSELGDFGRLCDRQQFPRIDVGGFIVPGDGLSGGSQTRGKEDGSHGERSGDVEGAEEAGSAAGSRQGRRASATAGSSPTAHTLRDRVSRVVELEGLWEYYPDSRILRSSSGFAVLTTRVGIFHSLPHCARLYLEIPLDRIPTSRKTSGVPSATALSTVPDVRVWAVWEEGVLARSFHQYPDLSICAFMPRSWQLGDSLKDYTHWCVCWLAKSLHLELLDRWPGRQHCSAKVAVERNKPDEYCRCGGPHLWRDCHMETDLGSLPWELLIRAHAGEREYLKGLHIRGWSRKPPWER
jgi:hypothetical protein